MYEISVRSMNIDDRPTTNDRPTSGPIHTFWKNFKWPYLSNASLPNLWLSDSLYVHWPYFICPRTLD